MRLEPLEPRHEAALWEAGQDERVWRLMRERADTSRDEFHDWFERMQTTALGFAQVVAGRPLGHTSYLNVREDDRVLEIGP